MTTTTIKAIGTLESLPRTEAETKTTKESSAPDFHLVLAAQSDAGPSVEELPTVDTAQTPSTCRCHVARIQVWNAPPPPPPERQFAFFFRISGTLGEQGGETQELFHAATQALGTALRQEPVWTGNPMGAYLTRTEDMFTGESTDGPGYLEQVMLAAKQGLGRVQAEFMDFFHDGGDQATTGMSIPTPNWATLTDSLDLSASSKADGMWRPMPHNRNGQVLSMVSSVTSVSPVETTGSHTTSPRALQFLDRFLALVDTYLSDLAEQEASTITQSGTQKESDPLEPAVGTQGGTIPAMEEPELLIQA